MKKLLSFDWKASPEDVVEQFRLALRVMGVHVHDLPSFNGSDTVGIVVSDERMTKKDIKQFEEDEGLV